MLQYYLNKNSNNKIGLLKFDISSYRFLEIVYTMAGGGQTTARVPDLAHWEFTQHLALMDSTFS